MKAMASRGSHPLEGNVEVDETVIDGEEKGTRGRKTRIKNFFRWSENVKSKVYPECMPK